MLYNITLPRYSINNKKEVKNFANIRLNMTIQVKIPTNIKRGKD